MNSTSLPCARFRKPGYTAYFTRSCLSSSYKFHVQWNDTGEEIVARIYLNALLSNNSSMDSTKAYQVVALLCAFVLLQTTDSHVLSHYDARSLNGPAPGSFVDSLFKEYGTNKSMNLKQFSALLKDLRIGKPYPREQESVGGSTKEYGVTNGHSEVSLNRKLFFEIPVKLFKRAF